MGCFPSRPTPRFLSAKDYIEQARTGDVLLFSSDGWDARLVKCITASPYSHCGMVIRIDPVPSWDPGGSGVYLWHAPSSAIRRLPDLMYEPPRSKGGPRRNRIDA